MSAVAVRGEPGSIDRYSRAFSLRRVNAFDSVIQNGAQAFEEFNP